MITDEAGGEAAVEDKRGAEVRVASWSRAVESVERLQSSGVTEIIKTIINNVICKNPNQAMRSQPT